LRQIEPPIEAVEMKAPQVAISVLFRSEGMELPLKAGFQVG